MSNRIWRTLCAASLATAALACDSAERDSAAKSNRGEGPLYAVMYEVFNGDASDSYLSLFDSLDLKEIDTERAREFAGGRAFLRTYNEWVFLGEPLAPIIRRFSVTSAGELEAKGELSFANFGLSQAEIDDWTLNFISPTKAYLFDSTQGTTIIWNPTKLTIEGEIPAPDGYLRGQLTPNTSTAAVREDRLFRAVYWVDDDTTKRSEDQLLLIYDTETDELIDARQETRCNAPSNRSFVAEDGTIYFSNWIWSVAGTLLYDEAPNCVLRINPDEEAYDSDWTLRYSELAPGREGAIFTYLESGRGVVSIFQDEGLERDETTDPYEFAGQPNWELWSVDVAARSGARIEGVPRNSGAYTPLHMDDRSFVMIPSDNWENTQLYEVTGGRGRARVNIPGWSYMFVKIR